MEKFPKYGGFGRLKLKSWAHMIKLESQDCPYLPLHGAEVAWLLVEVFVN